MEYGFIVDEFFFDIEYFGEKSITGYSLKQSAIHSAPFRLRYQL